MRFYNQLIINGIILKKIHRVLKYSTKMKFLMPAVQY